ncbi:MAG: two-component regulator propeller domain-containing protein, partial [Bacteroidota bacterium]
MAQGLRSPVVHDIQQDSAGFVWVATSNGLVRLTGMGHDIFTSEDGLSNNSIKKLVPDGQGGFWVLSAGALARFENGKGVILDSLEKIGNFRLHYAASDSAGGLWVSRKKWNYFRHISADYKVSRVPAEWAPDSLERTPVPLFTDPNGSMWVQTETSVMVFRDMKVQRRYPLPFKVEKGEELKGVLKTDGQVIVNSGNDLYVLNPAENTWKQLVLKEMPVTGKINAMALQDEMLWLGTTEGLFNLRSVEDGYAVSMHWLPGDQINVLFIDQEKNIWIGTQAKGVMMVNALALANLVHPESQAMIQQSTFFPEGETPLLLASDPGEQESIVLTTGGSFFWIEGTAANGNLKAQGRLLADKMIRPDAIIWVGPGRYLVQAAARLFWIEQGKAEALAGLKRNIAHISRTLDGRILLLDQVGMFSLLNAVELLALRSPNAYPGNLPQSEISPVASPGAQVGLMGPHGDLWIGMDNGLEWIPRFPDGEPIKVFADNVRLQGGVQDILQDREGRLWLATDGAGLLHLDADTTAEIHALSEFKGRNCQRLFYDAEQNSLWVATPKGLAYVTLDSLEQFGSRVQWITREEGLLEGEIQGIFWQAPHLYLTSQQGLQVIDWNRLPHLKLNPGVSISAILQGNNRFDPTQSVVIKRSEGSIDIHWVTPSYLNMGRQRFEYQLLGLNSEWTSLSHAHV